MSLGVTLDIIGTPRMTRIDEISEERDESKKRALERELSVLSTEERITSGLLQFEVSENMCLLVMDKIQSHYTPKLKTHYAIL